MTSIPNSLHTSPLLPTAALLDSADFMSALSASEMQPFEGGQRADASQEVIAQGASADRADRFVLLKMHLDGRVIPDRLATLPNLDFARKARDFTPYDLVGAIGLDVSTRSREDSAKAVAVATTRALRSMTGETYFPVLTENRGIVEQQVGPEAAGQQAVHLTMAQFNLYRVPSKKDRDLVRTIFLAAGGRAALEQKVDELLRKDSAFAGIMGLAGGTAALAGRVADAVARQIMGGGAVAY
jgi:hypothetical protein